MEIQDKTKEELQKELTELKREFQYLNALKDIDTALARADLTSVRHRSLHRVELCASWRIGCNQCASNNKGTDYILAPA